MPSRKPFHPDGPGGARNTGAGRHHASATSYQVAFCAEFLRDWGGRAINEQDLRHGANGISRRRPARSSPFLEAAARPARSARHDRFHASQVSLLSIGVCWIPYSSSRGSRSPTTGTGSGTVRVDVWKQLPQGPAQREQRRYRDAERPTDSLAPPAASRRHNTTTQLPYQCVFNNVAWQTGDAQGRGLDSIGNTVCTDQKVTAGAATTSCCGSIRTCSGRAT